MFQRRLDDLYHEPGLELIELQPILFLLFCWNLCRHLDVRHGVYEGLPIYIYGVRLGSTGRGTHEDVGLLVIRGAKRRSQSAHGCLEIGALLIYTRRKPCGRNDIKGVFMVEGRQGNNRGSMVNTFNI